MQLKKIIIILLVLPLFAFTMHKYYVSLCEIEYLKEDIQFRINNNFINKEYKIAFWLIISNFISKKNTTNN